MAEAPHDRDQRGEGHGGQDDHGGFAMMSAPTTDQPEWICEALGVATGRPTLLVGDGGAGKTIAALSIALAAATGSKRALGGLDVGPGAVLWLSWEQSQDACARLCQRVAAGAALAEGPTTLFRGHAFPGFRLTDSSTLTNLSRLVRGYSLCVIDSLSAAIQSADSAFLNSPGARGVLDLLNEVSAITACQFLVLHHIGKPRKGQHKGGMLGSAGLRNAADCVLYLAASGGDEGPRTLTVDKASWGHRLPADGYTFHYRFRGAQGAGPIEIVKGERVGEVVQLAPHQRSIASAERSKPKRSKPQAGPKRSDVEIEADVRAYLAAHPGASQNEVEGAVEGTGTRIRAVYKALKGGASEVRR